MLNLTMQTNKISYERVAETRSLVIVVVVYSSKVVLHRNDKRSCLEREKKEKHRHGCSEI